MGQQTFKLICRQSVKPCLSSLAGIAEVQSDLDQWNSDAESAALLSGDVELNKKIDLKSF